MRACPSVVTTSPYEKCSDKYSLISTLDVLDGLKDIGFFPVAAMQARSRNPDRRSVGKHMIRLRREQDLNVQVAGNVPEIVLVNSHDGSSSYQLRAGIYRLVCSNGMIVGDDTFCQRVRHQGDVVDKVVNACGEIIDVFPEVLEKADQWKGIQLSRPAQLAYADAARSLKWDDDSNTKVEAGALLIPRRSADQSNDLWTTFNRVQENLIRGGVRTRNKETRQLRKSSEVNSPSENSRLNTALWKLTQEMERLAT